MKLDFKKISKLLPEDFFRAVRDISLLNCSVFGEFYAIAVKEKFGVGLSVTFWSIKDRQIVFYRSEKENTKFSRKLAEHYKKDENYAKNLAKKLIKKTDWFNNFLAKNKSFKNFKKSAKVFFDNYKEFFALHQAIYWGGNYLSKLKASDKEKKKVNRIIEILNSAYKYNEMVIPNIEKYFKRLKISNFLYDEIVKNIKTKPKRRSLLFVKNKRFILSNKEASKLEKIIEEKIKKSCEFVKGIKGLAVTKGKYRGRVRSITDFKDLKNIKKGEVLVIAMTRPHYNKFIKQAGAIITDEGGVLSHAAIISREFNIPCVVGIKIATKVLKDGDLVEVDANRGVVEMLKRS